MWGCAWRSPSSPSGLMNASEIARLGSPPSEMLTWTMAPSIGLHFFPGRHRELEDRHGRTISQTAFGVHRLDGLFQPIAANDDGDGQLAGTLRDGDDVHLHS